MVSIKISKVFFWISSFPFHSHTLDDTFVVLADVIMAGLLWSSLFYYMQD